MGGKSSKPPKFQEIHDGDTSISKDNNNLKPGSKGTWNKSMESLSKMSNKTSSSFTMVWLNYCHCLT